jgi:hypothetical protein
MVDTGRVTVQTRDLEKAIEAVTRVYCSHQIAITGRVPEIDAVLRVCGPTAQPLVSLRRYVRAVRRRWPALTRSRVRGLLGRTEPSLMRGGRTMGQYTEAFVGIDTAKKKHALAIADPDRDGEIRYLGEIDSAPAI